MTCTAKKKLVLRSFRWQQMKRKKWEVLAPEAKLATADVVL